MTQTKTDPYPSEAEQKATRAPAIVVFLLFIVTIIVLVVMLTLQIAGVFNFRGTDYTSVFFGGVIAIFVTAIVGTWRSRKKGTKAPLVSRHRPDRVQDVVDRLDREEK